ncbi:hypothetical protein Patl1_02822 [Pistacia atlantica]|uniref:Uncharacterized protein n=1 Tax=Pistacia atlantica TaxID=434234 RepID=A0ACC1CBE8_9ROSI|nr:hypothetical protein Patl1_02822 [Pistacia atlantica]
MQVPTGPETVNTRIQGNVEIAEGDRFFESPSAVEIACEVSKQMDNVKIEIADETGNAGSEVMEESKEKPEKNDKSPIIENLTGNSLLTAEIEESNLIGKGILKEERSIDPHSEVITDQDVSVEDKSMEKETVDMHENEKVESNEEVLGIPEAKLDQNGEASIHTPDLTVVSLNKDGETIIEEKSGETNSKEIENEAEKSTILVDDEKSLEAIESSEIIGNGKDENKISMNNGAGDAFTQRIAVLPDIQSYEEENLKISEADEEIVYKPYATPATEASSIHEELELKENTEVIEKIAKDDCISSAKDESHESPEQEGDGSFMKHAGTLGVNEGAAAIDASSSEDRNEDGSTFLVSKDKTGDTEIINALEDSQSGMSSHEERSEDLQQNEPEEEKLERSLSVVDEDFIVATSTEYAQTIEEEASIKIHEERFEGKITDALDHSQSGTSDHEEKPENLPQNEPEEEKLEGSLSVVDVDSSIVASTESAETTSVQGETPFKSQEESFEEIMKEDLPIHTDTDSKNEIPEDKNVPLIELNEMIERVEVEVPNENANDIHDTHPLIEVAKQTEEINLDNVSSLEPEGKAQEVNEATPEEEKHIEDQPEPYQSWNLTILEHPSTEGKVKTEPTPQTNETDIKELDDVPGLESDEKSTIKGNIASEKSKEENYIEQVVELDSIEQVPVKSLEDEEKNAEEATGEISENSKTERAAESIEHEASKTTEGPQEIPDTCHVKEEESLQKEGKNITATESSSEEKPERNETFSSEANETPFQMEEGAPQTLEEAPHKEEIENETEENNDTKSNKIAIEEDLQVVVETSDASKSTESTIPEPKTEISNMVAEDEIKMEDTEELHESCKDTGKDEEAEKQDSEEDYVILPEPSEEKTVQCSEENKEEEKASKIEACTQLEATSVTSVQTREEENIVGQSRELEAEKIEQSSEEGHTVTDISLESIEQETVEIHPGDANKAEKSGGDLNPESVEQFPVKNLEDEEKKAKDFKGEVAANFEHGTEETAESIVHETCKTNESPREIVETFQVKQGDSLQCEENNVTVTESSSEEKPLENEPAEQLEKPLSLESNENKAFISDSDKVHSQMEESPPQNLEEASQKEEEKLERSFSAVDEDFIIAASTEYVETIEDEASIKIHEERFEEKITDALDHSQSGTSDCEEKPENLPQNEPEEEKLEGSLSAVDVDSSIVASTESAETTASVQGETLFKSQEESFEELMKEDLPIHTHTDSKNEIPEDKNVPLIELNEMIERVEVEVPNENANDIHDTHPLIEVAKQTEEINLDNVSSLEPEGKAQEVNEATPEKEKHIEDQPEPYQSWNLTILEHPSTEGKVKTEPTPQTNETDIKELDDVPGLESDEKSTIKGNIASEKSKEENYIEQVVELDSVEQVPVKSLEDEEKNAEEATGEISENSKTERAAESIEHEASKTTEGPQEIPDTCHVKEEESLQKEGKNITATESSPEEKPERNETFSSEANETPFQMEEGAPQTLEEAPHKEETENETEENNDTKSNKIAIEEDLQVVVETSDASKSTESTIPEPKTEISNMVAEDEIKMEDTEELHESCKDTGKDEEAEKQDSEEDYVILPEPSEEKTVQCSEENKEEEKASKIEACTQLEATSVTSVQTREEENIVGQSRELEAEKIEQSSEEGHTVTDIPSESIEQETVEIYPGDANEAEKSGGDLNPESVEQVPVKNLEDEKKKAKDFTGELAANFEPGTEETAESIVHETCKTNESPRETVETFQVKQGESLQCEENNVTVTESSSEEKPLENELAEQLEKPLSLESNKNEAFISDSDQVHSQMEESPPQNLEEASQKEENEKETDDNSDTKDNKITMEEDHQALAEIYDTSKSTESTILETKTVDNMVVEDDIKKEESEEICEDFKDAGEFEETEKHDMTEECITKPEPIGENIVQSSEDDDKKEETPKTEACAQLEASSVGEDNEKQTQNDENIVDHQSRELEVEKTEQSSKEDQTVLDISSKPIEEETAEIYPGNLNEAEKPGEEDNRNVEDSNIRDGIPESDVQVSVENLGDEEKKAKEPTREVSEKSKTEETAESITNETCKTTETPREILDTFQDAENLPCQMEEGAPQNLKEDPYEEENEKETEDNKIKMEEDNQAVAETSDASKSAENTILEPKTEMDKMVDEDDTGKEQYKELCEDKDVEEVEEKENIVEKSEEVEVEKIEPSCIEEHEVANMSLESIDREAVEISWGNEIKAEESEGKSDVIIEENNIRSLIPEPVEQVSEKNLEDEEKKAKEFTEEILDNSKTEEAAESTNNETSKTIESLREILDTFQEKRGESLQSEEKDLTAIESSQSLEKTPQKEENEKETEENNDTKDNRIAIKEGLQEVAETSDANKTTESSVLELKTEEDNMVVEDDIKKEESKELFENSKGAENDKHEMTEECRGVDKKEEETSKIKLEATGVVEDAETQILKEENQSAELEAEKSEKSFKEDQTIGCISPESIEQETVEISPVSVNKTEKSEGEKVEQIVEESITTDLVQSVEQAPVKNLEDEEKKTEESTGEISDDSKVEEAIESIEKETGKSKTTDIPGVVLDTFQVTQGESLPTEETNLTGKESSAEEKIEESLSLMSNADGPFSSDGDNMSCLIEEEASRNLEGAPLKAEKENETEDNNETKDNKIETEEDLQAVAETSVASKSAESIIMESKSEMDNMTAEDDIKNEEPKELCENFVGVAKVEEIENHDGTNECVSTKEIVQSSEEDKKEEETPKIEVCSHHEPTSVVEQSREFEVEKTEQSFKEEHRVADISPQSIEQEAVEIPKENESKAEESEGKNKIEQVVEESNTDTIETSPEEKPPESEPELEHLLTSMSDKNEAFSSDTAKMPCLMEEEVAQNLEEAQAPQEEEHVKETDDIKDNEIETEEDVQKSAETSDASKSTECTNMSLEPTGEKILQSPGDDKKEETTSKTEANSVGVDTEKQTLKEEIMVDQSSELVVEKIEQSSGEDDIEAKMAKEDSEITQKVDEDLDAKKQNVEGCAAENNFEASKTADFISSKENQSMEDTKEGLLSSTVEKETVEESSQEDEIKAVKLKEEVDELSSAFIQKIEETNSRKETVSETLKDSAESNVNSSPKEINECLVEKSSLGVGGVRRNQSK